MTDDMLRLWWDDTRHRLDNFVVGLTNNNPATTPPVDKSSYTVCAQYNGSVTPGEDSTVICAPASQKFRYVIVQSSPATDDGALCMADVSVFARSKQCSPTYWCVLNVAHQTLFIWKKTFSAGCFATSPQL